MRSEGAPDAAPAGGGGGEASEEAATQRRAPETAAERPRRKAGPSRRRGVAGPSGARAPTRPGRRGFVVIPTDSAASKSAAAAAPAPPKTVQPGTAVPPSPAPVPPLTPPRVTRLRPSSEAVARPAPLPTAHPSPPPPPPPLRPSVLPSPRARVSEKSVLELHFSRAPVGVPAPGAAVSDAATGTVGASQHRLRSARNDRCVFENRPAASGAASVEFRSELWGWPCTGHAGEKRQVRGGSAGGTAAPPPPSPRSCDVRYSSRRSENAPRATSHAAVAWEAGSAIERDTDFARLSSAAPSASPPASPLEQYYLYGSGALRGAAEDDSASGCRMTTPDPPPPRPVRPPLARALLPTPVAPAGAAAATAAFPVLTVVREWRKQHARSPAPAPAQGRRAAATTSAPATIPAPATNPTLASNPTAAALSPYPQGRSRNGSQLSIFTAPPPPSAPPNASPAAALRQARRSSVAPDESCVGRPAAKEKQRSRDRRPRRGARGVAPVDAGGERRWQLASPQAPAAGGGASRRRRSAANSRPRGATLVTHPVTLRIYDITKGKAARWSKVLLGKRFEGVWHTGLLVYGFEYFYGDGVLKMRPSAVEDAIPMELKHELYLGDSAVSKREFEEFLVASSHLFTPATYDIFSRNCNHFSEACAQRLLGRGIPRFILSQDKLVARCPNGHVVLAFARILSRGSAGSASGSGSVGGSASGGVAGSASCRGSAALRPAPLHPEAPACAT